MPVLVTCKFDEDPINMSATLFSSAQRQITPMWPKIELVRDLTPVLVTCKFADDPIKHKVIMSTTFFPF